MTKPPVAKPLLDPDQAARLLDDVIYERIISMVEMEMILTTERVLRQDLAAVGVDATNVARIAKEMIDRALARLVTDRPPADRFPGDRPPADRIPVETAECALCDAFGDVVGEDLVIDRHGPGSNGLRRSGAV